MIIGYYLEKEFEPAPQVEGTSGAGLRWLTDNGSSKYFFMRHVIIEEGGAIGLHEHPYEHQVFITKGKGKCIVEGREYELSEGCYALVPGGVVHCFVNTGKGPLEFICCINRVKSP